MANSPVQIVLNSDNFIELWERQGGGPKKDFFAQRDVEFIAHQEMLSGQLNEIKARQIENEFASISYAKVTLKRSGLAKVHRPTSAIFRPDVAPVVGAADLGELFVELRPGVIDKLTKKIREAETQTRWKENKLGKLLPNPTKLRSEVGVIEKITPYTASDKRKFSVSEAVDWLAQPQTGGAYIIELFEDIPARQHWDSLERDKFRLYESFISGMVEIGQGLSVSKLSGHVQSGILLSVKLEESQNKAMVNLSLTQSAASKNNQIRKADLDPAAHARILAFLDNHPLVRKITLPPIITKSAVAATSSLNTTFTIPKPGKGGYPKLGIIDGGVSAIMDNWVEERWGLLAPLDKDEEHGTFIAGLAAFGNSLNGGNITRETDGCIIIDLDLLPTSATYQTYYKRPMEFFNELEIAVKDLNARTGVRIFNFSLNIEEHVTSDGYSPAAKMLDRIAEENDVIFIISAGNTQLKDTRKEWPSNPLDALKMLASSRNDTIKKPAESCRNLCVAAVNPPNLAGIVPYAPSNYSCRGPGIRIGLKPDLAHIGGCGTKAAGATHGLFSINTAGQIIDGCGTSYSTPHVSRTMSSLDHAIEGLVSRETLMGLMIHHATVPDGLRDKNLNDVIKHLIGFGIPGDSESILAGNDHAITLVFSNRVYTGKKMSFHFTWPPSLVREGKCFGDARLTIVSTPPFDYRFGAEFVRVNVEAHLRQQQKDGAYKGRLDAVYTPDNKNLFEKDQIEYTFKWSPVKVHEKRFSGVGPTTNWRLDVEYLARDGENLPAIGVPFTALLTIADPHGQEPVFNDMRQTLQSLGVQTVDIKTAARVTSRV